MLNIINNRDEAVTEENMYSYYPKVEISGKAKDITNMKFGYLEVLYKTTSEKAGSQTKAMWVCKCTNCGNIVKRRADHLYNLEQKSCGCPNIIDITGQKFNSLTAISVERYTKNNGWIWKCQCDCGGISYVGYCALTKGYTKTCGCGNAKSLSDMAKFGSKGERLIKEILTNHNINFEAQKTFYNLKDINLLPFDFYLPDDNCIIEYDGQQHFYYRGTGWDTESQFKITQKHDYMKTIYCFNNNINLIRIPYDEISNIVISNLLPSSSYFLIDSEEKYKQYKEKRAKSWYINEEIDWLNNSN